MDGKTHGVGGLGIKLTDSMVAKSWEVSPQKLSGFSPGTFWPPVAGPMSSRNPAPCWKKLPAEAAETRRAEMAVKLVNFMTGR